MTATIVLLKRTLETSGDSGRLVLENALGNVGNKDARSRLLEYTGGPWSQALARQKSAPRKEARRKIARIGAALERLGREIERLNGDAAILAAAALRIRRGPAVQHSRRASLAALLKGRGEALRTAGERHWQKQKNEDLVSAVYLLAAKYNELLGVRPERGTGFRKFATAALETAVPGRGARAVGKAICLWLAQNPRGHT